METMQRYVKMNGSHSVPSENQIIFIISPAIRQMSVLASFIGHSIFYLVVPCFFSHIFYSSQFA
jgi:hypothetical protein